MSAMADQICRKCKKKWVYCPSLQVTSKKQINNIFQQILLAGRYSADELIRIKELERLFV